MNTRSKFIFISFLFLFLSYFIISPVRADDSFLNEPPFDSSPIASSNPITPSILTITNITQDSVTLSWTKNPDPDFAYYRVLRVTSLVPSVGVYIAQIFNRDQTSFTDTLPQGTTYYYQIRTYNQSGEFVRSNFLGALYVPQANITVDGSVSDWSGLNISIQDYTNDKQPGSPLGTDISNVYLAHDNQYFYVRMDLADGPPNIQDVVYYSITFDSRQEGPIVGDKYLRSQFFPGPEQNQSVLRQRTSIDPPQAITIATDIAAAGLNVLEMRVPLNKLDGSLLYFYVKASTVPGPVGYYDGTVQMVIRLPILPVPFYYQNDPLWAGEQYDHLTPASTETISKWGCALTSGVMVLRFHDVTTGAGGLDVNPSTLNAWLKEKDGYLVGGDVNFKSFKQYSDSRVFSTGGKDIEQYSLNQIISTLNWDLNTGYPVIIKTEYIRNGITTSHYVVATGKTDDTWFINDPVSITKKTLADYQNKILGIRTFGRGVGPTNRVTFYIASPAELFLIDPLGKRIGIDPTTNQFVSEILQSSYYEDEIGADEGTGRIGPVKVLDIMEPIEGEYQLQIIGMASGSYNLTARTEDRGGGVQQIVVEGVIAKDIVSVFDVDYSSIPGIPTEIERIITVADTVNDTEINYELGGITQKFVKDILIAKLKVAQKLQEQKEKQLEHFDELIEKAKNLKAKQMIEKAKENYEKAMNKAITAILKSFIKEAEIYPKKGWITKQASEILIKDANYIIGHL